MKPTTRVQLSVMMFLNFFVWGAWYVTMGTYLTKTLNASGEDNGAAYGTQSLGAILAPFIIGLIADRFFAAQRILGILHLVGAALMYFLAQQNDFNSFYPLILAYMIIYMPTLALVNSISFRQLTDNEKQFAIIRVFGTIGWIAAGLLIGWLNWEAENALVNTFKLAAGASLLLGIYSFFLPHTPPASGGKKVTFADIIGLEALSLLKKKDFLIFFISSILICIPLAFYYQEANKFLNEIGLKRAAATMTLGQVSETLFLVLMPLFFRRFGIKTMLLIGMISWGIRYLAFGFGNADDGIWLLYLGIILHGICYDFFFVTGQIYTDKRAGPRIKSAAQGMITLATYGIGMWIGFFIAGRISDFYEIGPNAHEWQKIWMVPAAIAGAVVLLFLIFFKDNSQPAINTTDADRGLAKSPVT